MLQIFRWKGGYAGETIVSSILSANPDLVSNIVHNELSENGRTIATNNKAHVLSSLASWDAVHDFGVLEEKIEQVISDDQTHIVKNHCYHPFLDKYSDYIVDIISTNNLLSFTTLANFNKMYDVTSKILRESNRFYRMLEQRDKNEADYYMIYNIALSHYKHNCAKHKSKNKILLDKWIDLQYNNILGYDFDRKIYKRWQEKNNYIVNGSNVNVEKICDLVKQQVPYSKIRKQLV